ncbi:TolC family protein [Candidatus Nitrospira bockiana]
MAILSMVVVCVTMPALVLLSTDALAAELSAVSYDLQAVIALALERSPIISAAQASIEQSRGHHVAAGAYLNPTITGSAGRGAIRDPSTGISIVERTITVEQPLEWPAKRAARQRVAEAGVAGASAGLEEARLNLRADVKVAFYQLLLAQRDAEMALKNLAAVEELFGIVKARIAAGEATRFEALKAQVEVQKAWKEVSRTQNTLLTARVRLNRLTADGLPRQFTIQGDFELLTEDLDLDRLTALALERHPSLRRLAKLVEQAEQAIVLERESRIPTVAVSGTYHREAGDEAVIAGLSVPIPLWYRRQGEIQAASAAKHRADAERARVENELVTAVTEYAQEARTAREQIDVFEKGLLRQAEEALEIARVSFKHGAASLLELLDAQRVYRQTLLEYAQARSAHSIALARLDRWTGGIR